MKKFATLQRVIFHSDEEADQFAASAGRHAAAKIAPKTVRLLRPFKLVEMSEEEISEFVKGPRLLPCPAAPSRPFSFHS